MDSRSTRREILKKIALGVCGVVAAEPVIARRRYPAAPGIAIFFVGTYTRGRSKGIYGCRLDLASGSIRVDRAVSGVVNPSYLAIDKGRRRLFTVSEVSEPEGSVSAFAMNCETGELHPVNSRSSGGGGPCYLTLDSEGRFLLVANYSGGSLAVLPVADDGSLGEASDFVQHAGSSVSSRQQGPHPHSVILDARDRFAYAADLGLDKVMIYRFDDRQGRLHPATPGWAGLKPGAGPRHLACSPDGASLYVVNELDSTVTVFATNGSTGALEHRQTISTLPGGFVGENYPADIHMSPSGKFVYCSNRGHDSIAVFAVNERTGELSAQQHEPTQGKWPRNFAMDPSGQYLLVANQRSNSIRVFSMDDTSGLLFPTGQAAEVPMPVCVKFV